MHDKTGSPRLRGAGNFRMPLRGMQEIIDNRRTVAKTPPAGRLPHKG